MSQPNLQMAGGSAHGGAGHLGLMRGAASPSNLSSGMLLSSLASNLGGGGGRQMSHPGLGPLGGSGLGLGSPPTQGVLSSNGSAISASE